MLPSVDVARIGKPIKTLFGWLIFRRLSRPLSIGFAKLGVAPIVITLGGLAVGLTGAGLFATGTRSWMLAGAALAAVAKILDACDGEVARMRHLDTSSGYVIDGLTDRLRDTALLIACATAARTEPYAAVWAVSAVTSYLAFFYVSGASPSHWREARDDIDVSEKHAFRVTRALRLGAGDTLVVSLALVAIIGQPIWLVMAAALLGPPAIAYKVRRLLASRPWEREAEAT